jgi:hypothetical protein
MDSVYTIGLLGSLGGCGGETRALIGRNMVWVESSDVYGMRRCVYA